jgi:hypothetical protein
MLYRRTANPGTAIPLKSGPRGGSAVERLRTRDKPGAVAR